MIALLAATVLVATSASAPAATSADGLALQKQAATRLAVIVEETFADIARHVKDGVPLSEKDARARVLKSCEREGLVTDEPPVIAFGPHSADPGYGEAGDTAIKAGDFLLLSLAAKKKDPGALYADVTWVAFVGKSRDVPPRIAKVWNIVRDARDRALAELKTRAAKKLPMTGDDIDFSARSVVEKNRHGPWFPHATGHSLGESDFGPGPNLKKGEKRALEAGQCFTVEPGVYYPAEFGVRSGVDVCLTPSGAEVTSGVAQREIRALLE